MKVKDLIKLLTDHCNQDAEVVLASDAEGNSYSVLAEIDKDMLADTNRAWDVDMVMHDDFKDDPEGYEGYKRVILLYPT